ncbi:MAG: hypothetical protein D4R64_09070 [Porphyromonadaceae bacterium]|nr:MAG: hypothetical protein D4R64_09070 [Porphyromonadaceae bacterium]
MKKRLLVFLGLVWAGQFVTLNAQSGIKDELKSGNSFYAGNLKPLETGHYIKLPVGSIEPGGWLKVYLERQRDGLTGQLGNISAWLQKTDNAWLSKDGKGKWGWEEVPYWLKGYGDLAYILKNEAMIAETKIWIEAVLSSQQENGDFGPPNLDQGKQDFWPNMIMLYCLQSYYEYSGDKRVLGFMSRYFKYQLTVPDEDFLKGYWQGLRSGDNLYSAIWLYNRTGERSLLELGEKIHRCGTSWISRHTEQEEDNNPQVKNPEWYKLLPDWHNVNVAQGFREPAIYSLLSHNPDDLQASYEVFQIIREHFGQVPGGMYGSDEVARPGYDDPRQGIETCGIVEQMNSDENMLCITGDNFWADHAENVAFNTYPAATMPDFKSLHYLTAPNMVLCDDQNHAPGVMNAGPFLMMNPFSSRCCQHNHSQGWPYYAENLWLATPDNGVFAALYCQSTVKVKVGTGTAVEIAETTHYPFDSIIRFDMKMERPAEFPLYLRVPKWCTGANVKINGTSFETQVKPGSNIRIKRLWKLGDQVELLLPMQLGLTTWEKNHRSVSVNYGPLTFSLKIQENYIKKESDKTAIGGSKWQEGVDASKWPSWEIHPGSDWNFGLVLDQKNPLKSFKITHRPWPESDFPFTLTEVPVSIEVKARQIPEWTLDQYRLCGVLMDSPVKSNEPEMKVELVPMGAARLRISAFPVIRQ